MFDFLMISTRTPKRGVVEVYPKFKVGKRKDLMIRGSDFYAVWLEDQNRWSTDEDDVIHTIDEELTKFAKEYSKTNDDDHVRVLRMEDSDTKMIDAWHLYCKKQQRDSYHDLDESIIFSNTEPKKEDYSSKHLPYALSEGDISAWDELVGTLYSEDERHKIEWAIGAVVTGASKDIQKFLVFYGKPGSGKSTIMNIIAQMFDGYYAVFDAKSVGSVNDVFALEQFKSNPLVAICHDTDLSHIDNNARFNSLTSHEQMSVNEKHKALYTMRFNSFLFIGTNKPVKITDAKAGILRRLIDVSPTGKHIPREHYDDLLKKISFELGAIAAHCRDIFLEDPMAYEDYRPMIMMDESNDFYNFVLDCYSQFKKENGVSLKEAWKNYKSYCDDAKVPYPMSLRAFKIELKNYFDIYEERIKVGEDWIRNYYSGFKTDIFDKDFNKKRKKPEPAPEQKIQEDIPTMNLKEQPSNFDIFAADFPAQYANEEGTPMCRWDRCKTTLKDIDTTKLHYVKIPEEYNIITLDFDYKDEQGNKSLEKNLLAASKWPETYTELSKSGCGVHLEYIYEGDPSELQNRIDIGTEILVSKGGRALRRKLTKCNNLPINKINSGLPLKEVKKVVNFESLANEKALRTFLKNSLQKAHHGATKPEIDFIYKTLEDCYNSGMKYDVEDEFFNPIYAFAASSSNQADYCMKLVSKMHFKSDDAADVHDDEEAPIVIFDCEVFPNLIVICWKKLGKDHVVNVMVNPKSHEVESLLKYRLVGYNCRKYDNHILYALTLGRSIGEIYNISQRIISGVDKSVYYRDAYDISYTDIYDFSSIKQTLKKFEIALKILHKELGLDWNEPVPEKLWPKVIDYCKNDVVATEAVWYDRQADFRGREILASLAGMNVNTPTNTLTSRIIFGNVKHPQLNYTNLATGEQTDPVKGGHYDSYIQKFPGYEFQVDEKGIKHNWFRGDDLGFGGYAKGIPGVYYNLALLDIASMHPHSLIAMDALGEFTKNFEELVNARILIKHKQFDEVAKMFDGKLAPYLGDPKAAKDLAYALKIAINAVYGLTSASFDNEFKHPDNRNNIVALRGALFMRTLEDELIRLGYPPVHIKTDSMKIPNATPAIISYCMEFAKKYGYTFEHEATYERMCLLNDAVYIARYLEPSKCQELYGYIPGDNAEAAEGSTMWTATGTEFKVPYVFKSLFSGEPIEFEDFCEVKEVKKGAIYIRRGEELQFVGRVGLFCSMKPEYGGELVKSVQKKDGIGFDSVTGTKGYLWAEAADVKEQGLEEEIDISYYENLANDAKNDISQYIPYEKFIE